MLCNEVNETGDISTTIEHAALPPRYIKQCPSKRHFNTVLGDPSHGDTVELILNLSKPKRQDGDTVELILNL